MFCLQYVGRVISVICFSLQYSSCIIVVFFPHLKIKFIEAGFLVFRTLVAIFFFPKNSKKFTLTTKLPEVSMSGYHIGGYGMLLHACSMSHVLLHKQSTFPLKWRMYQSSFLSKKIKKCIKV